MKYPNQLCAPACLGNSGALLRVEVRERPLFATLELALAYCLSETVDSAPGGGHAIAVRYTEIAGFEDDILRRLEHAPRRWLIAGWECWEDAV